MCGVRLACKQVTLCTHLHLFIYLSLLLLGVRGGPICDFSLHGKFGALSKESPAVMTISVSLSITPLQLVETLQILLPGFFFFFFLSLETVFFTVLFTAQGHHRTNKLCHNTHLTLFSCNDDNNNNHNSNNIFQGKVLKIPKRNLKSFGELSFSFMAPSVWNSLPADLRNLPTLSQFKSYLKTFLFTKAFPQIWYT